MGNSSDSGVVIFFSLTEAPLPDPTPTPPNTPKRTRNGAETEPKRSQTEPKRSQTEPKWTEIKLFGVGGTGGGVVGVGGGGGVVREKRKSLQWSLESSSRLAPQKFIFNSSLEGEEEGEGVGG